MTLSAKSSLIIEENKAAFCRAGYFTCSGILWFADYTAHEEEAVISFEYVIIAYVLSASV